MPTGGESRPEEVAGTRGGTWRLDDLEVDAGRRVVRRGADELAVSGLSLDLLIALLESAPNVVTANELMDRVWGKVIVAPETLTQRVKLLRSALGDDPHHPRYILGVRGRGYRLIPKPERMGDAAQTVAGLPVRHMDPASRSSDAPASEPWPMRSGVSLGAMAAVVVAMGFLVWTAWDPAPAPTVAPLLTGDAVAVMPFNNIDGSDPGATLAQGMAEALLQRLATLRGVTVISRYSSFALSDSGLTAREIGERLNARYLVEGSVQGSAHRMRVRTALTDLTDGRQLWSLQFDRGPEDLLAVQDEIAARVAETLAGTPGAARTSKAAVSATSSAAAQLAYLQGSALVSRMTVAAIETALQRFDEATRVDPGFASAHAGAAAALLTREELRDDQRQEQRSRVLEQASERVALALAADPRNGEALIAKARIESRQGDYEAADRDFRDGIDARPNDAESHLQFARFLFYGLDPFERPRSTETASRIEQRYALALQHCDRAAQIDPLSPMARFVRGQMALHLGRVREAEEHLEAALSLDPNLPPALGRLSQLRWLRGELADAVVFGERAVALDPDAEWIRKLLSQYYVELGEAGAAAQALAEGGADLADGRLAILLLERRWQDAGDLAMAESGRQPRTWDRDFASFALRELARRSPQDADEVLTILRGRIGWKQVGEERVIHHSSRFAALAAADLLLSRGEQTEGRALIDEVIRATRIDQSMQDDRAVVAPVRTDGRVLALAAALSGDANGALSSLEGQLQSRQLRHLWYDIELQPALEWLRSEPRFVALRAAYRAHVRGERDKLVELRAQGAVPSR